MWRVYFWWRNLWRREPEPEQSRPRAPRLPWWATLCVAVVIVAGVGGFFHVVHGGGVGLTICTKDGWALEDTFVDVDDYAGKPILANLHKAKVLRALFACGVLELPDRGR